MITEHQNNEDTLNPREMGILLLATFILFFNFVALASLINDKIALIVGELVLILPALFFIYKRKSNFKKTFRIKKISIGTTVATIIVFFITFIISDEIDRIILHYFPMPNDWEESMYQMVQLDSIWETIFIIFTVVLLTALVEEMLFRGIVQKTIQVFREPAIAVVLSSVIFAIFHINIWSAIQLTLLGIILGYVTWKSDSIIPAIVIHGLTNLCSLIMMNLGDSSMLWYSTENHVKIIWLFLSIISFYPAIRFFNNSCKNA